MPLKSSVSTVQSNEDLLPSPIMNEILLSSNEIRIYRSKKHTGINVSPSTEQLMKRKILQLIWKVTFHTGIPFLNTVPHKIHILVSLRCFGENSKWNSCPKMLLK